MARWKLKAIDGFSHRLDITLSVDTNAVAVLEAIERAAEDQGIQLVEQPECLHPHTHIARNCDVCGEEMR